jgi:CheY-like chemotaxis protein
MTYAQKRSGTDRRRQSRGGRRPTDTDGSAPLVMVVGQDAVAVNLAEAVLAKLRFAVTTSSNVDDAMRVLQTLKPEIVVAASADAGRIRLEAPEHLSVVEMTDQMREDPLTLVESIRKRLRANAVK